MSEITHAYIRYADKTFETVPIRDVKFKKNSENHITPTDENDFDKRRYYYVKWSDCDDDCQEDHVHFGFYPAFILLLGVSAQDIEKKVEEGRRLIIPRGVPSSGSEENVKPTRNQKQPTLVQNVQKKKNLDVLNKHKATTLLSSRKRFDGDSDERDEEREKNDVDGENSDGQGNTNDHDVTDNEDSTEANDELEKQLQNKSAEVQKLRQAVKFETQNRSREKNKVEGKSKIGVRRNLFHQDDDQMDNGNPQPLEQHDKEHYNKISNNADDAGCSASLREYGHNSKPTITSIETIEFDMNRVYESSTEVNNRNKPKDTRNSTSYEAQQTREGDSNDANGRKRKMVELPHPKISCQRTNDRPGCSASGIAERHGRNVERVENENGPLHDDANEMIEPDDNDNPGEDEQIGKERLPLQTKKRRREPTGTGMKGNTSREIEAMIEYYQNREEDDNGRKMYEVAGTKIYLGEDVEASAALWFLIRQKKPTLFFRDMLELIWPQHKLLNRCLSEDKITTRLLNRSPMKEVTPRKKRLSYKLYSDYLDSKKITETEKMKFLSKVPALITAKIQYLRSKYYE